MHNSLIPRILGYGTSFLLTLATFWLAASPNRFSTVPMFLGLALIQALVQSICFLPIWHEKGPRWNVIFYLSTISMILIILVGSIWIMNHLNAHMH